MQKKRFVVGLSGGVDSAVTAALLKEAGHDVYAITLTLSKEEEGEERRWQDRSCCKVGLARYVAEQLSIPHEVIDLQEAFQQEVIDDFCDVYLSGATPNPCVRCNERIKFGRLLKIAKERKGCALATGHYAQTRFDPATRRVRLFQGEDRSKDQSYFLYRLRQSQLDSILFPLGGMQKGEVYQKALEMGLPYEEVLESQEICFVNQRDYREVLAEMRPEANHPGPILDQDEKVVGTHKGIAFYTIGQRRGLGVSAGQRQYVTELRLEQNVVVLGKEEALYRREVIASTLNWIRWEVPPFPLRVHAKVRYRTPMVPAKLETLEKERVRVLFDTPLRGVTPGQSVVFYQENEIIGGGIIVNLEE